MPAVYTSLERELTAAAAARRAPLRLAHYRREGWTFHAKGLWLWPPVAPPAGGGAAALPAAGADAAPAAVAAPPPHPADAPAAAMGGGGETDTDVEGDDAATPVLSLLGSSNLGHRSVHFDLEFEP